MAFFDCFGFKRLRLRKGAAVRNVSLFVVMWLFVRLTSPRSSIRERDSINCSRVDPAYEDNFEQCRPVKNVTFARTFRTGGSTVQNILFRRWMSRQDELTFGEPYQREDDASDAANLRTLFHAPNYANVSADGDVKYVTLLRDPLDTFESGYAFLGLRYLTRMDINDYVWRKLEAGKESRYDKARGRQNSQLWDLGVDEADLANATVVADKIAEMDARFDLVMIAERFDESLVLLAELLCWPLREFGYIRRRKRVEKVEADNHTRSFMRHWLKEDYQLYDHFVKKFDRKVEEYGFGRMEVDVAHLAGHVYRAESECVVEKEEMISYDEVDTVVVAKLDEHKPACAPFVRGEDAFWEVVKKQQQWRNETRQFLNLFQ